ncbi:hypothetical protein [Streptomyces sp. NBC_00151]|uniref:hypothetical protein n=1 Tax=Streptomyces sp. NBC_00151 TaxID=2975669 RepID=UPI002DDA50B8|nr:hypothetical protein [Streptomyces sp. NBC_00151]WRZ38001.1 hypothetical protein OG915_07990 [Streptomyces sp. NBC_00151]
MTIVVETAVACVFAWAVRKARRVGGQADAEVDYVLDAAMDKVHGVVVRRLGSGGEVERLELEAAAGQSEPSALTRGNVVTGLEEAVAQDAVFAQELQDAVKALEDAKRAADPKTLGAYSLTVGGDMDIKADNASVAGGSVHVEGDLSLGNPPRPGAGAS